MPITLNFELSDKDLEHFQAAAERSRKAAEGRSGRAQARAVRAPGLEAANSSS